MVKFVEEGKDWRVRHADHQNHFTERLTGERLSLSMITIRIVIIDTKITVVEIMQYQNDDVVNRSFRRLKGDVIFTLCAVAIIQILLTIMLIKIYWL